MADRKAREEFLRENEKYPLRSLTTDERQRYMAMQEKPESKPKPAAKKGK